MIESCGGVVYETACVVELPDLKGRDRIKHNLFVLVEFEGDWAH